MSGRGRAAAGTAADTTRETQLAEFLADYLGGGATARALDQLKRFAASLHVNPRTWEKLRGRVVQQIRQKHASAECAADAVAETAAVLGALERGYREAYRAALAASRRGVVDVLFSPHDDCRGRLVALLDQATSSVDACVFTITSDPLAEALLRAAARGAKTRIITESDTVGASGCDIARLEDAGIEVRYDCDPDRLMHHKFAIVDHRVLATGSLNWTHAATRSNFENLVVSSDPDVVNRFQEEYQRMWARLLPPAPADAGRP
jgi:phosphatidylserine/phosphatidylglycerophosphate/cardiolipin synthase-like enzyme